MIIYNITVQVEPSAHDEWLKWMKEEHIIEVMKTGFFTSHKICRILDQNESEGITYAIQYSCQSKEDFDTYNKLHAPRLKNDHEQKFANKFVAFRTLMEEV